MEISHILGVNIIDFQNGKTEAYSEPSTTSKMEDFGKTVNGL